MRWKATLRVESHAGSKAQWLSEDDESLDELKKRMAADGSPPTLYNFEQVP